MNFEKWNEEMYRKFGNEERYSHKNFLIRYITNKRLNQIIKYINAKEKDKILEIGCGDGLIINKLKKGWITGIDYSESAVKKAKENNKLNKNIKIIKGDAQNLKLDNNSFNKIICAEVIEHLPNPEKVINEIKRIAKPKSKIVLTIPNDYFIDFIREFIIKIGLFDIFFKGCDKQMDWHIHKFRSADYLER